MSWRAPQRRPCIATSVTSVGKIRCTTSTVAARAPAALMRIDATSRPVVDLAPIFIGTPSPPLRCSAFPQSTVACSLCLSLSSAPNLHPHPLPSRRHLSHSTSSVLPPLPSAPSSSPPLAAVAASCSSSRSRPFQFLGRCTPAGTRGQRPTRSLGSAHRRPTKTSIVGRLLLFLAPLLGCPRLALVLARDSGLGLLLSQTLLAGNRTDAADA